MSERIRFHLDKNVTAIALGLRCDGIVTTPNSVGLRTQSTANITRARH